MILKDFLLGVLTSTIPIFIITSKNKDVCDEQTLNLLKYIPFLFGVINVFIYIIVEYIITNFNLDKSFKFLVAGILAGIIYSSIGRFYTNIPQRILGMDLNKFQIYALIVWSFVYAFIDCIRNQL